MERSKFTTAAAEPPRVPLVLGVTGHRNYRLEDEPVLRAALEQIFRGFGNTYPHTPLVLLSSLAEGGDQLAADVALKLARLPAQDRVDIHVRAPLPFPVSVFAKSTSFDKTQAGEEAARRVQDWFQQREVEEFVVPLPDGRDVEDPAGWPVLGEDDATTKFRRSCYANAGVYIARHCHALIALWNEDEEPKDEIGNVKLSGTAEFVRFKLTGEWPKAYPRSMGIGASGEAGPVYILRTPRAGNQTDRTAGKLTIKVPPDVIVEEGFRGHTETPFARFIHRVIEGLGGYDSSAARNDTALRMKREWRQFRSICSTIEEFNRDITYHEERSGKIGTFQERLNSAPVKLLGENGLSLSPGPQLDRLARVREAAGGLSTILDPWLTVLHTALFGLILLAATAFHLYAHLFQVVDEHPDHEWGWLAVSLTALVAAGMVVGWVWYVRLDERRLDYRALAEALRVRCWWAIAGIGASVADSYLNQLRGEMSWARRALQSLAPPPQTWQTLFAKRPAAVQRECLNLTRERWIKPQAKYFAEKRNDHHKKATRCRRWGLGAATAGWILGAILLARLWYHQPVPPQINQIVLTQGTNLTTILQGRVPADARHPSPAILISSGVLVLAGGLLIAYCERRSHEDLSKQYDRMATVFVNGMEELKRHLPADVSQAADLKAAQEVIKELGREALIEHAQWLILRRARPFELPIH